MPLGLCCKGGGRMCGYLMTGGWVSGCRILSQKFKARDVLLKDRHASWISCVTGLCDKNLVTA